MLAFFTSKGILLKKLQSYGSILKLSSHIRKEHTKIDQKRKISDNEIMTSFCGIVKVPPEANDSNINKKFEKLLRFLCNMTGYNKIVREP